MYMKYFCMKLVQYYGYLVIHYSDVIMSAIASQITSMLTVCSAICPGAYKKKSSVSLAFARETTSDQWIPLTKCL